MEQEIWKDIIGYEGLYKISNLGRVKSLKRKSLVADKIIREYGSLIRLVKNNIIIFRKIHILLAEHFIPNPNNETYVRFIDGNPLNKSINNLAWGQLDLDSLDNEIWKDIIGYEGLYKISNLGRVKSLSRKYVIGDKIIKPFKHGTNKNYYSISLQTYDRRYPKKFKLHRLIAEHFIPNPDNKSLINHIDSNPSNNSINNLEWVDVRENMCHSQISKKNNSRYIGVYKSTNKGGKSWRARIYHNNKLISLGYFDTEEEAYAARIKYEKDNGIENKYL
jgi:hypothetical protein